MRMNVPVEGIQQPQTIDSDHQIIETMRAWAKGEPVWSHAEILERWGHEFLMYRTAWADPNWLHKRVDRTVELFTVRRQAIKEFGFSIPCRELLDALEQHQPIIEIGAGSGYLTLLMRHRNINVIGTDSGRGQAPITLKSHDPQQVTMTGKRAIQHYRDRTVFCSWPSLNEIWFRQALQAMRIGQRAIIIEEDACAEQTTWEYRDAAFDLERDIELPAWPMLNDRAAVWIKKREGRAGS